MSNLNNRTTKLIQQIIECYSNIIVNTLDNLDINRFTIVRSNGRVEHNWSVKEITKLSTKKDITGESITYIYVVMTNSSSITKSYDFLKFIHIFDTTYLSHPRYRTAKNILNQIIDPFILY